MGEPAARGHGVVMEVQKLEISLAPGHLPGAALAPNP